MTLIVQLCKALFHDKRKFGHLPYLASSWRSRCCRGEDGEEEAEVGSNERGRGGWQREDRGTGKKETVR